MGWVKQEMEIALPTWKKTFPCFACRASLKRHLGTGNFTHMSVRRLVYIPLLICQHYIAKDASLMMEMSEAVSCSGRFGRCALVLPTQAGKS